MSSKAKYLPADERRAIIVESVITLAGLKNPSEITTAAIAQHMHLTQGALFRHFSNKESIWQAVMEWVAEQLLYRIDEASKDRKSALEALEAMFITHIEFAIEYPGAPRILFGELQRSEQTPAKLAVHQLIQNYSERLWRLMERGKANQEFAPTLDSPSCVYAFHRNDSRIGHPIVACGRCKSYAYRCFKSLCYLHTRHYKESKMNPTSVKGRTLTLLAVIISLLVLFIYVALRSGPLAP